MGGRHSVRMMMSISLHSVGKSLLLARSRQLFPGGSDKFCELEDVSMDAGESSDAVSLNIADSAEDDGALEGDAGWLERRRVVGRIEPGA